MYMLEYAQPHHVKEAKTVNYITYRWKQLAMSEDLKTLQNLMGRDERIIDWDTLEVICSTCKWYRYM